MKLTRSQLLYSLLERPVPVRQYGHGNGAWNVVDKPLSKDSIAVSVGVGHDISFDLELSKAHGCRILLLDPTPTGATTIAHHSPLPEDVTFDAVGIAAKDEIMEFFLPIHPDEGSFRLGGSEDSQTQVSFACERLQTIMRRHGFPRVDLLKLDIEGFEYAVLADILTCRLDIRQICVEFHHGLIPGCTRWQTIQAILRLRLAGFQLVNHEGLNHTFLRISSDSTPWSRVSAYS